MTELNLSPVVTGLWRLGEWRLGVEGLVRWIERALELGVTSFDHADIYGGYGVEGLFGDALAAAPGLRERLQIVTKCGIKLVSPARPTHAIKHYDSSRAHVLASVDQSLRALRTDRIDLLLVHRPDPLADPDELAETFTTLRAQGKVLHFGVSNHAPSQLATLHRRIPLATNQIEFSPLHLAPLSDGTLDQCTDLGLRPMLWSPLAGGRLFTSDDESAKRVRRVLGEIAHAHGVSPATVAYAWLMRHPSRPRPITGSSRIDAVAEAVAAQQVTLDRQQWTRIWTASTGHDVA
ncbi:MAG TPA: aldo/keto reductase [Burkholderiaceae bacterium]|nr:aldo/keto reductase [Burkholderiaceae bacterium]